MNEVSLVLKSVSVLISSLKEAQSSSAKGKECGRRCGQGELMYGVWPRGANVWGVVKGS